MKAKQNRIAFPVKFEVKPETPIQLKAFLFSRRGKLLEAVNVANDQAAFKTQASSPSEFRVLFAPVRNGIEDAESIDELIERFKAHEAVLKINTKGNFEILPIPKYILPWWLFRKCRVRGRVTKKFRIHDLWEDKGLCRVRVHICEVDRIRLLIERIPDRIFRIIPDIILNPRLPFPIPEPEPDPGPFPGPDPRKDFSGSFRQQPVLQNLRKAASQKIGSQMLKSDAETTAKMILDNESVTSMLMTRDVSAIRNAILNNFELFHPFFCHIHWLWPYFYRCDEIKVVYTDENGNFETDIYYNILGDHPDLYFWVEALIDGVWTTVYNPGKACHTYWNYVCGSMVNIRVTDPRVVWQCEEVIPGQIVWVKTVGHGTSVAHIQQDNSTGNPIQGVSMNRIGLSDRFEPAGNYRRPFGKNLYFIVQFSSGLPTNTYKYYRWSYRKTRNADLSPNAGSWKTLNNPVEKPYTYEYIGGDGNLHFDAKYFKLGPFDVGTGNDLYLIPPDSPYESPVNAGESNAHWDQNTVSISFDSNLEGDGLYEFKLELFNSAGNKLINIPNAMFQIPHYDSFYPSVNAPADYLVNSGGGNCDAFTMNMRIDNSACQAEIYKLKVDGVETNPTCCGFVKYGAGSMLEIAFRAFHPNNFADFNFVVQKGTCTDTTQSNATNANGMVIAGVNGYARNLASIYSKTLTVGDLLGICTNEGKAAFAEHLYVNALSTDGNYELDAFDAWALAAFALEPM
ncbi:MAG: hypothetical protein K1X85_02930 [Ignavibacteria bacterium]|nr:hypothetical protein [Ignavibacteria bacterium]